VNLAVPTPARLALPVVVLALAGGCSMNAGSLDSSATTMPRTTITTPPTTAFTPIVGTLPLLPGQVATPAVTVPEYTIPVETTTESTVPPTVAAKPVSTSVTATTAAATTPTKPEVLGVQAGAYSNKKSADLGLAALTEKGFPGFAIVGKHPYRIIKEPLDRKAADALVAALKKAGLPALITVRG
jgi:hypothetical protein